MVETCKLFDYHSLLHIHAEKNISAQSLLTLTESDIKSLGLTFGGKRILKNLIGKTKVRTFFASDSIIDSREGDLYNYAVISTHIIVVQVASYS